MGNVSQLGEQDWYFILVDLDLLVVELVERVVLVGGCSLFRIYLFWFLLNFWSVNHGSSFLDCRVILEGINSSLRWIDLLGSDVLERGTRLSRF